MSIKSNLAINNRRSPIVKRLVSGQGRREREREMVGISPPSSKKKMPKKRRRRRCCCYRLGNKAHLILPFFSFFGLYNSRSSISISHGDLGDAEKRQNRTRSCGYFFLSLSRAPSRDQQQPQLVVFRTSINTRGDVLMHLCKPHEDARGTLA